MSRYEAVPHPRDPKLVYYRKVKGASEPQVVPVKKSSRQSASSVVPAKRPPRKSASGVVPAKRPKGEKRVVPAVRPANPGKVVPVIRKNRNFQLATIEQPPYDFFIYKTPTFELAEMYRGKDFPSDYYGFIDESYLEIEVTKDSGDAQLRLDLNDGYIHSDYFSSTVDPIRGRIFTIEFFHNGRNRNLRLFDWPETIMPAECLDHTVIRPHPGHHINVKNVRMILNGTVICQKQFSSPKKITNYQPLDLTSYIRETRLGHLRKYTNSNNPILITAALEWGKAWNIMKYGGVWRKSVVGRWEEEPVNWCSEFASWVIRQGSNLHPPAKYGRNLGSYDLARYFIGQGWDTDLFLKGKKNDIGLNRFITPNNYISLWDEDKHLVDPNYIRKKYDFVGMKLLVGGLNEKLNERREWLGTENEKTFTFFARNPRQCSYNNLPNVIKPGFYVKIKRGTINEPIRGHSTLFVDWIHQEDGEWKKGFVKNGFRNYFWGLGGNQDDRVKVKIYEISESTSTADIFWKASSDATGAYGYQDGFGDTRNLSVKPTGIRGRR